MRSFVLLLLAAFIMITGPVAAQAGAIQRVIVIALENTDASQIYGNTAQAPYINGTLMPKAARATAFMDLLPLNVNSEAHYVVMEAGTNVFSDNTFNTSNDPSATNSTGSHEHFARQLLTAKVSWMSYQQSITAATGTCPIVGSYPFAPRHDPFVFFRDVTGSPPSKTNVYCSNHHRPYSSFPADLAANRLARYVFITPDLCHDMHDDCTGVGKIRSGDNWLKTEMPRILTYAQTHATAVYLLWDEGSATSKLPFLALGPGVRQNFAYATAIDHRNFLRSLETIFGVPALATVAGRSTIAPMYQAGKFP